MVDGVGHPASTTPQLNYSLTQIYNCTGARDLALSDQYLFLINGGLEIILFENENYRTTYFPNAPIGVVDIAAWNQILYFDVHNGTDYVIRALSVLNSSDLFLLSEVTTQYVFSAGDIGAYQSHVYWTCQEFGFPIFDFSNVTSPQEVGKVPLETWHSWSVHIVSHYGLFGGDMRTGLFDLNSSPSNPELLWINEDANGYGFAVSEK